MILIGSSAVKHMFDCQFLIDNGAHIIKELWYELYNYWNHYHTKNTRSDLKMTASEFFNNAITCEYSHDDLHTLLADPPTYTKVLQEDEEVLVSEDKFNTLSMDQKLRNSPNRYPRVERVTIKDISIFDEGKQGDSSEFHEVYQIVPDVFIKLIVNTDSYGSNEFVAGFQIVTPKIKTVTAYEPI